MRPARAKALIINAFALAGRFAVFNPYTQGAALGYVLLGLSARFVLTFDTPSTQSTENEGRVGRAGCPTLLHLLHSTHIIDFCTPSTI